MLTIKVQNMKSGRGNPVPNQFIIKTPAGLYFQSYQTVIAHIDNDRRVFLDKNSWDYSRTTGKYRNLFLGENKTTTEQKIKDGVYILTDLN